MSARDVIADGIDRSIGLPFQVQADAIIAALTAAGYRILGPELPNRPAGPELPNRPAGVYRNLETGLQRKFLHGGPQRGKWLFERPLKVRTAIRSLKGGAG